MDFNIGTIHLYDQFEWPLFSSLISASNFATILVRDLNLSTEFIPKITHSIHEQVLLARLNYDSTIVLEGLESAVREEENLGPKVKELDLVEVEQMLRDETRHNRRLKRNNRYTLSFPIESNNSVRSGVKKHELQDCASTKIVDTISGPRNVDFELLEQQLVLLDAHLRSHRSYHFGCSKVPLNCYDSNNNLIISSN